MGWVLILTINLGGLMQVSRYDVGSQEACLARGKQIAAQVQQKRPQAEVYYECAPE